MAVALAVIVAGPLIVAVHVHVHGNATVGVIERFKKLPGMRIPDCSVECSRTLRISPTNSADQCGLLRRISRKAPAG